MRDVIKIFAAGSILTAYALLTPTMVEAVPTQSAKVFSHRLDAVSLDAPVSAVLSSGSSRTGVARGSALPRFAAIGVLR